MLGSTPGQKVGNSVLMFLPTRVYLKHDGCPPPDLFYLGQEVVFKAIPMTLTYLS